MAAMNGYPFDAKHTFHINRFSDIEKYANLDETWVEPEPEPYKPKVSARRHFVGTGLFSHFRRSTSVHGSATRKAATSTSLTATTMFKSSGMASLRN